MPDTIEVRVSVSRNGLKVPGFDPYIYRGEFNESSAVRYTLVASGEQALPVSVINSREVTIVRSDQDVTCEFNQAGGDPGKVNLAAGGIVVAIGLQSVANSLLATIVENLTASDANIDAVVAGDA